MLGVVATIKVKPGSERDFELVARELVAKVNAHEPGCALYALHHGEAAGTYVFLERYVDQAAAEAHRGTDHFKTLGRKLGEYMDGRPRERPAALIPGERLNLDDVGAVVRQVHGRAGRRPHLGQVEDADSRECLHVRRAVSPGNGRVGRRRV